MKKTIIEKLKLVFLYCIILFFVAWLQTIAIALLFPVGGGVYHILFQLIDSDDLLKFVQKVYRSYLLVGLCTSLVISFIKKQPKPLSIGVIASIVPALSWYTVTPFIPETSFILYLLFLTPIMPTFIIGASYMGVMARKLIFTGWNSNGGA